MTFLYPSFLWALTALALPFIIHLFNFRKYKKVYFTNVRFLRQVQIETKSKSKLREWLVLLFRSLLIAALVFAFSQPSIKESNTTEPVGGSRHISVYIDNSFSMENVGRSGPLLDQARQRAKEIVQSFGLQDKFQILTNDFQGKQQRFYDKEQAIAIIDEIRSTAVPRKLDQVIERQREFLNSASAKSKRIFVLSDAQKSTFRLSEIKTADSTPVALVPLLANLVNNLYIDSCWFESPVQQNGEIQHLGARVVNKGENTIESGSAVLMMNGTQTALNSFSLLPGQNTNLRFSFECKLSGFNFGSIKIEDYPVTFDDEFFFAFNSKINIPVYLINGNNQKDDALTMLFGNDSLFDLTEGTESQINYATFRNVETIVLNQLQEIPSGLIAELQKFSEKGGAIVIVPAYTEYTQKYTPLLNGLDLPAFVSVDSTKLRTEKIELASGFYAGVFERLEEGLNLPLVTWHYTITKTTKSNFEPLLSLINRDVFLGRTKLKQAEVYLFTASLSEANSNFSKHALFVPTIYRMCFSALKQVPLYYPVLTNSALHANQRTMGSEAPPRIVSLDKRTEIIPEIRKTAYAVHLFTRNQIEKPGHYVLNQENTQLQALAFNYERLESDLTCYTPSELEAIRMENKLDHVKILNADENDFKEQVLEGSEPRRLWKLFIILALVFLIAESAVLRILK
jgi:hypothetical protein